MGQLLEEDFVRLDIRYIAIMDNIDTADGLSDFLPVQDWFNEMHAKNTSKKVKAIWKDKGNSGLPLTTRPPFGYMKSPENKYKWIIDEPAAEIVRRIYNLCMSGFGVSQIARILTENQVMTPTEYWQSKGLKTSNKKQEDEHRWDGRTVSDILGLSLIHI